MVGTTTEPDTIVPAGEVQVEAPIIELELIEQSRQLLTVRLPVFGLNVSNDSIKMLKYL